MNNLALLDLIHKEARSRHGSTINVDVDIEDALVSIGQNLGISLDRLEDAIYSDRGLVIYEP